MKNHIIATVCLENSFWIALFERISDNKLSVARVIFGKEPTDPELYEWLLNNYEQLNFTSSQDFKLTIKRKNHKRMLREVKKEIKKVSLNTHKESFAQETLRLELEKQKKVKKILKKQEKEALEKEHFLLKQEKKKQKKRGH
jgi:hypothetical protein